MEIGQAFIDRSGDYLKGDYLPKIRHAIEGLPPEDIWWRPNPTCNSIGNLVLHLAGNIGQWVVSGIGGSEDVRNRDGEFQADGGYSASELLDHLEEAVEAVGGVLSRLSPGELAESRVIQGMDVKVLDALYHVVEHFSTHTGQIIYLTKLRTGKDLGFWEIKDGKAIPRW
ncbi:MAG: DUF1572 family protein [Gemmatimonadetes bacterium]|nr:DUF1572 domain-containing protein [Gemmatimonadota bacterium]NNM04864.1 DUF1572 family protein [Gemmatimonadota bacterium]